MDWLKDRTQAAPDKIALIFEDDRWTYAELNLLVDRMAASLAANGVHQGEATAVLMSNSLEYVCLIHALARLGAVLVPLNSRLTPVELAWQLQHIGCRRLIYDAAVRSKVEELVDHRLNVKLTPIDNLAGKLALSRYHPAVEAGLEDTQAIIFTSGTTGHPKGAVITYGNHFYSATASAFRLGHRPEDRWLSCLPLYHVGGLAVILRSCLYGTSVVLQPRFDVERINQAFLNHKITLISLVPTMLHRLLQPDLDIHWPDSLRLVLVGGAAASPELIGRCQERGIPVAATYGLTEAASQVATLLPGGLVGKPGSVGKPLMFSSVRIVGDNGQGMPSGEYGEVVVSGPMVMSSYHNDPEGTAEKLRDGELFTGDIGYQDGDGDLWIVQRRSDVINSGGENVYPAEIESVLGSHPQVSNACVVGIDSPEWGQTVAAMIVPHIGATLSAEELQQFCGERLARYKIARTMKFVKRLPHTASGKIHRQAVAKMMSQDFVQGERGEHGDPQY